MLPPAKHPHPKWLADAIFYEIYPQSFVDSNGDGIGDIPGITLKLDYIKDLGCNAIWLNPCFDSPFKDAGYDVRDYKKVASRYGTNDDLIALFDAAHRRDMHVILDLVPGHTSEEHEWFHRSCKVERNNYSDRYIWTDSWISGGDGLPFIGGESPRNGTYILNFFKCQPALNYGFAHPERSWQKPALGPDAKATCDAMVDVMRFWLSRGADGFRVDMADSLVKKDDEGKPYTIRTWQYMFARIRPAFPEAAFVSEWGRPEESMAAGFDMDFYLDWRWDGVPNGYNMLLRNVDDPLSRKGDKSYFNADSGTPISEFLDEYEPRLREAETADGNFNFITCNHDTATVAARNRPGILHAVRDAGRAVPVLRRRNRHAIPRTARQRRRLRAHRFAHTDAVGCERRIRSTSRVRFCRIGHSAWRCDRWQLPARRPVRRRPDRRRTAGRRRITVAYGALHTPRQGGMRRLAVGGYVPCNRTR